MGLMRRRGGSITVRVYTVPEPQPAAAPDLPGESRARELERFGRELDAMIIRDPPGVRWLTADQVAPPYGPDPVVFPPPGGTA